MKAAGKTRRVLLLMARTSYRGSAFMDAAARLGIDVAVGSNHRQVAAELAPGAALTLDLDRPDASVPKVLDFHRDHPIDAVLATEDDGVVLAAAAAAALGLPHNSRTAVENARYKDRSRRALAAGGIPSPVFRIHDVEGTDPATAAESAPYPCVLKPVGLSASRGVIRADDPARFVAAFDRIRTLLRAPDTARDGEAAGKILVEEYIPGVEVAVEALLRNGELEVLALFDKPDPLEGPHFEETLYITPSRLPEPDQARILEVARESAAALGLSHGPLHAELRYNEAGAWPLEVAPRSIGGLCSRVLRFRGDVSLEEVVLRHALGDPAPAPPPATPAAGVMMLPIPARGVLREVRGLEEARRVPCTEDVVIAIHIGGEVVPLPEGNRYLGFAFARGEDPADVEAALRAAYERLEFVIEAGEAASQG